MSILYLFITFGLASYGGVIRNDTGETVISFAGPMPNGSVIDVELHALWRGFLELDGLGEEQSILESNSKMVIGWASGSICPWIYLDKVEMIRHSLASFGFLVSWIPRSANFTADDMARQGCP